ncbi:MAG: fasciclin domain-containing protein, partial [Prevotellaceae bacterium]|nr:fasciclin domain-containing protein [Prevotellaceae bacterium]
SFIYILQRARLDRMMSSYGQYTCFAPSNKGVAKYIDSLYNDPEAVIPNNGMTENSLEGLSDSLCTEIAKYHLTSGLYSIIKLGGDGVTVNTMLGRPFTTSVDTLGQTVLNSVSTVISQDNEMTNGIVHLIDNVVPRSSRLICDELARDSVFTIFNDALQRTGLKDSLSKVDKGKTYDMGSNHNDRDGNSLYYPTECKIGFTIFAETDKVFNAAGIHNFNDLKAKCIEWYANATDWYDYPREKGIEISTGDDYTNRFNVVNMFISYHILRASMAVDQLVYERKSGNENWNYAYGGEPQDYFETMLPHTLMKIWQPLYHNTGASNSLWINRYRANNTLTDEVGLQGSESIHPLIREGVQIVRNAAASIQSYNGYIHRLNGILLYDELVPKGVLNERLRLDTSTFLYELINNGIRGASPTEVSAMNGGGNGDRVAFALDYFDNIVCYSASTVLRFNVQGAWRAHESDQFQGWNKYDFAVRIPSVPSGVYEIRMIYPPMERGGLMQYYIGTSNKVQSMQALGIPLDARLPLHDDAGAAMGWTDPTSEEDFGVASDIMLRNNGYMRAPCSFSRGTYNTTTSPVSDPALITGSTNCRTERGYGTSMIRRIVTRQQLNQSEDYWLRIKNLITDDPSLGWSFDFIELVPVSVVDNQNYTEDWY